MDAKQTPTKISTAPVSCAPHTSTTATQNQNLTWTGTPKRRKFHSPARLCGQSTSTFIARSHYKLLTGRSARRKIAEEQRMRFAIALILLAAPAYAWQADERVQVRDREQARLDREQAQRDREMAVRDREQ